jgi:cytochrome oxidase Cu insertion factor (SCO1/SenC/PrrC family)
VSRIPSPSRRAMSLLIAAPFIVVACTSGAAEAPADDATVAAATTAPIVSTDAPAGETEEPIESSWLDIELTDTATGETFTLASLKGQAVALEPMAIWCTNCKVQQDNVKEVYDGVLEAGVRYISLGVDPNENPDSLAKYAERREYPWTFATSSVEFARALSDQFGPQILSPPSTPLILLDAEGRVVTQEFGFHGPEKLLSLIDEATA